MRIVWALCVSLSTALVAWCDEGLDGTGAITWTEAFTPISALDAPDKLVLVVITNDDPALLASPDDADPVDLGRALWCGPVFARSLWKARQTRPEIAERVVLQGLPVGMPAALTGGSLRNQPARAIVAICDGNYRLLAFTVGVPDTDGMLTLIEDAEDTRLIRQMQKDSRTRLINNLAQRSAERLGRLWRGALEEMLVAMGDGKFDEQSDVPKATAQQQAGRLQLMHDTYEPHYFADVRLRFGLSEAADRTRLVILEQHPQTRRPWTESSIPFLADEDFMTLWHPLCETLWGFQPIRWDQRDDELLEWWDSQIESSSIVLSLRPPLLARRATWPPVADGKAAKRGLGWQDLQTLATKGPYRSIDAQQLSILIRARGLKPVDIQRPSRARYFFFEKNEESGFAFRESDAPGRLIGLLKKANRE